jgi:hypothetical protein
VYNKGVGLKMRGPNWTVSQAGMVVGDFTESFDPADNAISSAKNASPVHVNDCACYEVVLDDEHDTFSNFVRGARAWY